MAPPPLHIEVEQPSADTGASVIGLADETKKSLEELFSGLQATTYEMRPGWEETPPERHPIEISNVRIESSGTESPTLLLGVVDRDHARTAPGTLPALARRVANGINHLIASLPDGSALPAATAKTHRSSSEDFMQQLERSDGFVPLADVAIDATVLGSLLTAWKTDQARFLQLFQEGVDRELEPSQAVPPLLQIKGWGGSTHRLTHFDPTIPGK